MTSAEADAICGAEYGQRSDERVNRNSIPELVIPGLEEYRTIVIVIRTLVDHLGNLTAHLLATWVNVKVRALEICIQDLGVADTGGGRLQRVQEAVDRPGDGGPIAAGVQGRERDDRHEHLRTDVTYNVAESPPAAAISDLCGPGPVGVYVIGDSYSMSQALGRIATGATSGSRTESGHPVLGSARDVHWSSPVGMGVPGGWPGGGSVGKRARSSFPDSHAYVPGLISCAPK